jgi:hypothetical protein
MHGNTVLKKLLVNIWWELLKKKERHFVRSAAYTGKHKRKKGRYTFTPSVRLEVTIPVFDLPL